MKEYRRLDDTITMRLNRTNAQFRDRDRQGLGGGGNVEEQACAQIWRELMGTFGHEMLPLPRCIDSFSVANWKRRTEIINYCVGVVDQSMDEKRRSLDTEGNDPTQQRRTQGALYAEDVKVRPRLSARTYSVSY